MQSTTSRGRVKRPPASVSGTVALVRPLGTVTPDTGEVRISEKCYYLTATGTGYRLTGYDIRKQCVTTYDLPLTLDGCDCPDATFRADREGGCKHRRALLALQRAGKLALAPAVPGPA